MATQPPDPWDRVEALGAELGELPSSQVAGRLAALAAAGESPTVLSLLGAWLELPPATNEMAPGTQVGEGYTLGEKIGEGGMGTVWRANQQLVGREVALKIIHPALVTPGLTERFLAEVRVLGRLHHPGIIRIIAAGLHPQARGPVVPYYTMELVAGRPLHRWAAETRPDRATCLRLLAAVCAAVQSAHDQQIVHRDLKPANILVRADGTPVVVDFGIARLAGLVVGDAPGTFSGTPQYAAPEQHLGRDGNLRSGQSVDVYALGAILFELLAGRKLWPALPGGTPLAELRRRILEDPVPRLADCLPDCPPELDELVGRALRRDPADRFFTVGALGRALRHDLARETPAAIPAPSWAPAPEAVIPGTQWRLTTKLGEGGTGQVWAGRHPELPDRRVFKFCDTEEKARTLKRELTLFRLLKEQVGQNPHFILLHDVALDEPPWYLMMEYTDAVDLEAWGVGQPGGWAAVPETVRLEIVAQAAEALQAAHEAGILHRDLKPGNLLIQTTNTAAGVHVYVADFGIGQIIAAHLLRDGTRLGFTRTVSNLLDSPLSGTMLYLAPEVLEGAAATARSDIYSLGVILWQLLIGNVRAALDPSDWPARIPDPLLREDLARCLAGAPDKRWSSAGELAARLRALPERRAAAARRQAELAAREAAAYRRGVLRTLTAAAALVLLFATLAAWAWRQSREARSARGAVSLKQAADLRRADFEAGRRERGSNLLEVAAATGTNFAALRTAAAAVLGMADLVPVSTPPVAAEPSPQAWTGPTGETTRAWSHAGRLLAVARDLDGLNGAVDFVAWPAGTNRFTFTRGPFPWVPVAEPGLLQFSPDDQLLAIGGAATSRHVLLCNTATGRLHSYLFHGSDPRSCAWHPGGRLLAVGCADGTIHIWDVTAARVPTNQATRKSQFELPPALGEPAQDVPLQILKGHRGGVRFLAFAGTGCWLASLDEIGYLRIDSGFSRAGVAGMAEALDSGDTAPASAVEIRLEEPAGVRELRTDAELIYVRRNAGATQAYQYLPADLPAEVPVGRLISGLAWNGSGDHLCVATLTDLHWLRTGPLETEQRVPGLNPVGVVRLPAGGGFVVGEDKYLQEWNLVGTPPSWRRAIGITHELQRAATDQGAQLGLAAAGDGRVAAYFGKRIQFLHGHQWAPTNTSLVTRGGEGVFQSLLWDHPGRLLAAVYAVGKTNVWVESWATSTGSSPSSTNLPPAHVPGQWVAAANDGQHLLVRDAGAGLSRLNPQDGRLTLLNTSPQARQTGAFAVAPAGDLAALVVDRNQIRLMAARSGTWLADLPTSRFARITELVWDGTGQRLASATEDGWVQTWNLRPWQEWLAGHHLLK